MVGDPIMVKKLAAVGNRKFEECILDWIMRCLQGLSSEYPRRFCDLLVFYTFLIFDFVMSHPTEDLFPGVAELSNASVAVEQNLRGVS